MKVGRWSGFPHRVVSAHSRSILPLRLFRAGVLAALAAVCLLAGTGLQAQSAYSGGPLGGGFHTPASVAVDGSGNVYVADTNNNAVKEIPVGCASSSCVTTLGGGFFGPYGVAVDGSGNVYVTDTANHAVKKMAATCTAAAYAINPCVTTLGSGFIQPSGIAVDGSGNVYVADALTNAVKEILAAGGYTTLTTLGGGFNSPIGVALDGSGNVYVADFNSSAVKKMAATCATSSCVTTLGGGFGQPAGVAVDASGNVYVADSGDNAVTEMPAGCASSSCVTTLGGGFSQPADVAVDGSGNVYVADTSNNAVKEIVRHGVNFGSAAIATGTPVTKTLTFTFTASASLISDSVLTQGATGLDFADAQTGTCHTNGTGHTYNAGDSCTVDVTFTPTRAGTRYGAVTLRNLSLQATAYIYGSGNGPQVIFSPATQSILGGAFSNPDGVAVDSSGNVFVADSNNNAVKEMPAGCVSSSCVTTLSGGFSDPTGMAVDGSGNVYVADSYNNAVKKIPAGCTSSSCVTTLGGGFNDPFGVAVDGSGNIYVIDNAVKEMPAGCASSSCVTTLGGSYASLRSVAVDAIGNVYVADNAYAKVYKIPSGCTAAAYSSSSCTITTLGSFGQPVSVAVDAIGNVYVGDLSSHGILKETLSGSSYTQSTFVSGLQIPDGLAIDGSGNLYVGDVGNNHVVKVDYADAPTVAFAHTTTDGTTDSTDGAKTVTLENIGNAALSFSIPTNGNNPAIGPDFSLNSTGGSACPLISSSSSAGTLAAGASCGLTMSFAPVLTPPQGGALSESLVVTDTNLNANPSTTQSITLKGTAQATADYFTVTGPNPFPWYTPTTITITAHNADGTVDTGYSGTFSIASSDPGFGNTTCGSALTNGTESCSVVLRTPGTQTITVSDTASGFLSGTFTTVESPGPASGFLVAAPSTTTSGNVISVTVTAHDIFNNLASGYTGTVSFNSTDPTAVLPASYTFTTGDAGIHTFSVTLETPGSQTVTANDATNSLTGTSGLVVVSAPGYVVETASDDVNGIASDCPIGGGGTTCTLRDAIAASANTGAGNITFSSTTFPSTNTAAQNTITLTHGTLNLPSNTTITGATSGSGATLTNLVTVSGSPFAVFTVNHGVTGAAIANLRITNGNANFGYGRGIYNQGALTVSNSMISGNSGAYGAGASGNGGGIYNTGTLTVTGSTFSGNYGAYGASASGNGAGIYNTGTISITNSTFSGNAGAYGGGATGNGGAIYSTGTVTVSNSTFSGNYAGYGGGASGTGGAIYSSGGTVTIANSIVSGNIASADADIYGYTDNGTSGNVIGSSSVNLAPLANYGGPTQTMLPLPGSVAICAGAVANIPSGVTADQRGLPRTTTYGSTPCVDAGAVQTNYALTFAGKEPGASQVSGVSFTAGVTLTESGSAVNGVTIPLTLNGGGTLSGGSAATNASGVAGYTLTVTNTTALTALTLTATLPSPPTVTATSTSFDLAEPVATSLTTTVSPNSSFVYNQQPSISVALTPSNAIGITAADFTATLDTSTALTVTAGTGNTFNIALPATPLAVGAHSIVVNFTGAPDYAVSTVTIPLTVTAGSYVVTTLADDATGTSAHCPLPSTGTSCTLRDAVAAVNAAGGGNITFASGLGSTPSPGTITLLNGALSLTANATISGLGTTALVIDGHQNGNILEVGTGTTVAISNLTMQNALGINPQLGGAIYNAGTLTLTGVLVQGSQPSGYSGGAGIYNDATGTLTLTNSTIQNNGSSYFGGTSGLGGGILNEGGSVTLTSSTLSTNAASYYGGNFYTSGGTVIIKDSTITGSDGTLNGGGLAVAGGTVAVSDSTIANNSAGSNPGVLISGGTVTVTNSIVAANGTNTSTGNCPGCTLSGVNIVDVDPQLSVLGSYGGPTQTLAPLPGSPAICAINPSSATGADQRGLPRTTTYSSATCKDAGSVQTNFSLAFVQQPSTIIQNAAMSPAPTVQLNENGSAFMGGAVTIPLSLTGNGVLSGGSVATSASTGVASYSALSVSLPGTGNQLTANLTLDGSVALSATSNTFNVNSAVTQLGFSASPATTVTAGGNAGSTITVQEENSSSTLVTTASDTITLTVTGPNSYSKSYTATAASGMATFNLSTASLTAAGGYTYTASLTSVTSATANETVAAAAASAVTVVSGTPQSTVIGTAFTAPLKVVVKDTYGNPVSGATVTLSAPTSGASATFTGSPATTANDGTASVTATANGTASATSYTASASVSGATLASFLLTNTQKTTTLTVTPSLTSPVYGQPVTITAAITPSSVLSTAPSGSMTFYDGATPLTPVSSVTNASASYTISVPPVSSHTYAAQYGGDGNFSMSTLTNATTAVVVGKASTTLTGPTSPVSVAYGTGGTISIAVAGQYSGTGIATPSGNVSYTIGSGTAQTAAISTGAATLTIPATQAANSYTVTVSYGGDGNYNAATSITVNLTITKPTLTLTANNATKVYGTANPTFTGTVTGQQNSDTFTESFATTATTTSPVTTYSIVPSVTGTDLADYTQSIINGTLTITQAGTTTSLNVSSTTVMPGTSVTLSATVASLTSGTPTGNVSFYDNGTLLSAVPLTSGAASYPTTALAPGITHTITATYSGDTNFTTSHSTSTTTITVAPLDFTMTIAGPPSQTVIPGKTISYQVTVTPLYGSYAGTVNFAISGLPPGATATFSPASIAANGGPQTITVTIQTPAPVAMQQPHTMPSTGRRFAPFTLALLLPFLFKRRRRNLQRLLSVVLLMLGGVAATSMLSGCGSGNNGFFAQNPQNYIVTITATSGTLQHTATVTLNVQ